MKPVFLGHLNRDTATMFLTLQSANVQVPVPAPALSPLP